MTAARHNEGKATLGQLLHFLPALEELSRHCDAGRAKYPDVEPGVPNWTLGGKPDAEYIDAALRHLAKHVNGELRDDETGTLHLIAVAWNVLACVTLNHSADTEVSAEPDEELIGRGTYEQAPGRLVSTPGGIFFYTDNGPKVSLPHYVSAVEAGALVLEENE